MLISVIMLVATTSDVTVSSNVLHEQDLLHFVYDMVVQSIVTMFEVSSFHPDELCSKQIGTKYCYRLAFLPLAVSAAIETVS